MKCTIQGCPGDYEARTITHTMRHGDEVFVVEGVPADVCSICRDTLLRPETVRHLEQLSERHSTPTKHAPVYAYE